jgi:hypothetical protein
MDRQTALTIEINRSLKYLAKMEASMDPVELQVARERFLIQAKTPSHPSHPER